MRELRERAEPILRIAPILQDVALKSRGLPVRGGQSSKEIP